MVSVLYCTCLTSESDFNKINCDGVFKNKSVYVRASVRVFSIKLAPLPDDYMDPYLKTEPDVNSRYALRVVAVNYKIAICLQFKCRQGLMHIIIIYIETTC